MLKLIKMSFLNLFRYKSRSVITLVAIFVSVFISIIVDAFIMGLQNQSNINLINFETAEVVVYADGYYEKKERYPSDIFIDAETRQRIEKTLEENNILYSPRFRGLSEIIYYDDEEDFEGSLNAELYGIDCNRDSKVFALPETIEEGVWLSESDLEDAIVVGSALAYKLGIEVGSYVTVQATGNGGFAEVLDACVVGIFKTEDVVVNSGFVFMKLSTLDEYLALDGAVSVIEVSDGNPGVASSRFGNRIDAVLSDIDGIEVLDWQEDNPMIVAMIRGYQGKAFVILLFLFIIASAGIANIMAMSVMERRKECAMLRAVGFSKGSITMLFLFEGLILSLLGSIIGSALGAVVNFPLALNGLDLTPLLGDVDLNMGFRISLRIRSIWSVKTFIEYPVLAIFMTLTSTLISVRKAGSGEIALSMTKI